VKQRNETELQSELAARGFCGLLRIGWTVKRQRGSHQHWRARAGWTSFSPSTTMMISARPCWGGSHVTPGWAPMIS